MSLSEEFKYLFLSAVILLQFSNYSYAQNTNISQMPFGVYKDDSSFENHFVPSGWMGDYEDIEMILHDSTLPHSGKNCIKFSYKAQGLQGEGWAGVYFQHPTDNWGMLEGGYNLSKATRLTFYARGEKGGEVVSEFKVGGISGGVFSDTGSASLTNVKLTTYWEKYTIELTNVNLENIIGGFCWSAKKEDNPQGIKFYLDDIYYE